MGLFIADGAFWMGLAYFNTMRTVVNGITPQITSAGTNGVPIYKAPVAAPVSGERTMVSDQDLACESANHARGRQPDVWVAVFPFAFF